MALRIATLGEGPNLPNPATGDLFTAPVGKMALMKNLTLSNTNAGSALVNIWIKRGGTAVRITSKDLSMGGKTVFYLDSVYTLNGSDILQGDSDIAGVSYIASGATEI